MVATGRLLGTDSPDSTAYSRNSSMPRTADASWGYESFGPNGNP